MIVGLRIDVDTLRGTRRGVPNIIDALREHGALASFFFSVGPDNMGRHLWRLLRPQFALKMLRTRAARLYGWDILLRGVVGSGPVIGEACADVIRQCANAGHEVGLHAWDHHRWQTQVDRMDDVTIARELSRGAISLERIIGRPPTCFASPGWRAHDGVVRCEAAMNLQYASDCRGDQPFQPVISGSPTGPMQVPVTLPTYDEIVGRYGVSQANFVDHILSLLNPEKINVMTLHAEVEGIVAQAQLHALLDGVRNRGGRIAPLGELIEANAVAPQCSLERAEIAGREGWLAVQGPAMTVECVA